MYRVPEQPELRYIVRLRVNKQANKQTNKTKNQVAKPSRKMLGGPEAWEAQPESLLIPSSLLLAQDLPTFLGTHSSYLSR